MNIFDSILVKKPERSLFNLSHEFKLTGNMGYLYPILCQEVLPGDTWKVNSEILVRFAPMVAPIMHRVNVKINYFFVPNRLIWNQWEEFITGGEEGTSFPEKPYIEFSSRNQSRIAVRSLADYLGFPSPGINGNVLTGDNYVRYDALPFRAYSLIWNEYFRNQNLQEKLAIGMDSGADNTTNYKLLRRNWEKDYFTSALPFVQRGEPVKIPIDGGSVIINGDGTLIPTESINVGTPAGERGLVTHSSGGSQQFLAVNDPTGVSNDDPAVINGRVAVNDIANHLDGDIISVDGTINDLRTAYRLQRWLENNARAGSRYIEQLLSHFGVKSSDARLQRPEYLGGYSAPVVISEVLQNSGVQIDGDGNPVGTPQANMAGKAMALDKSHRIKKFFEEHGFIIGLLSVMPRTSYQQGLPRQYQRANRYDYYWPEFANLGEQDIKNNEVYFNFATSHGDDTTFGYQQRFAEYRYIPSSVHGEFKSNLQFWHLGRIFGNAPALNAQFVSTEDVRSDVFAVEDEEAADKLWIEVYNNIKAVRPMPKFAIPTL